MFNEVKLVKTKKSKTTKAAMMVIIIAIVIGLSGCTTFQNFKAAFFDKSQKDELTIQIGILEPVTGADSKLAEDEIRGIQLANETHPSVDGKMISLVFSDDKSDIDATETAVQTLISKKPTVILGSYGSVYSLAASPYIKEAKIPAISISNTNFLVTKNNDYYFRVCYVDSNQGDLLARYVLEEKKVKKTGVLLPENNDAAMAMATAFTSRIKAETENEDSIAVYETYQTGKSDYRKQLKTIAASGIQCVMLAGEYTDSANIISQAAEMGLDVEFLGDTSWGDKEFKKLLGKDVRAGNMAFVQLFAAEGELSSEAVTKERQVFLDAYAEKYGKDSEPSDNMALGYDAYYVALDAIDKANNATSKDVYKILRNSDYVFEGASGTINFGETGDPIKTAYIGTWENGKIKTKATIKALR